MQNDSNLCQLCYSNPSVSNTDLPICSQCLQAQANNLNDFFQKAKQDRQKSGSLLFKSEIDEILPQKLYLGNFEGAEDLQGLKAKGSFLEQNYPNEFTYFQIEIQDSLSQPILEYLDDTFEFIEKGKCVFVHCAAGINRSPAIVCAYLIRKNKWSYDEAFAYVKKRRPKIFRQSNFAKQLKLYEETYIKKMID